MSGLPTAPVITSAHPGSTFNKAYATGLIAQCQRIDFAKVEHAQQVRQLELGRAIACREGRALGLTGVELRAHIAAAKPWQPPAPVLLERPPRRVGVLERHGLLLGRELAYSPARTPRSCMTPRQLRRLRHKRNRALGQAEAAS